jgi:hypothetical protein
MLSALEVRTRLYFRVARLRMAHPSLMLWMILEISLVANIWRDSDLPKQVKGAAICLVRRSAVEKILQRPVTTIPRMNAKRLECLVLGAAGWTLRYFVAEDCLTPKIEEKKEAGEG